MTNQDAERRLAILNMIQDNEGQLEPSWSPCSPAGYTYGPSLDISDDAVFVADLLWLTSLDYLSKNFFDRLNHCPKCRSHHLNVREICPTCGSSNLKGAPLLHHFRCGYVAPVSEFPSDPRGGRTCPKCQGMLRDLGTDHEIPGDIFRCLVCGTSTPSPSVAGICLSCGKSSPADALSPDDIYAYAITRLGRAAVKENRLFEGAIESLFMDSVNHLYRHHIIRELLEDDRRRWRRYGIPVSALLCIDVTNLDTLRSFLREVDKIGQWDDDAIIVQLPQTDITGAKIVQQRLKDHEISAMVVDIMNDMPVDASILRARAQHD